jgi:hypothetical protein
MDKKPLIEVSILAVVLLVLGSLTNVVGYQTVHSSNQLMVHDEVDHSQQQRNSTNHFQLTDPYWFVQTRRKISGFHSSDHYKESTQKNVFYWFLALKGH